MAKNLVTVGMIALAVLLVEGGFAFPFLRHESTGEPSMMTEPLKQYRVPPTHSNVLPPGEGWPGLAVVDFRGYCITVYVLRLARPIDRPFDPRALLLSMRDGVVPKGLDATLDAKGFLYLSVSRTASYPPTGTREHLAIGAVFPGGHDNQFHHGEGSILAGTFHGFTPAWPFFLIESTSAMVIGGA